MMMINLTEFIGVLCISTANNRWCNLIKHRIWRQARFLSFFSSAFVTLVDIDERVSNDIVYNCRFYRIIQPVMTKCQSTIEFILFFYY